MSVLRMLLVLGTVTVLCPVGAHAVDGVNEINDTSITAAGGYPYTIPASGSYVLTGNLTPPVAIGALVLGAANVEIDLNGFAITGAGGGGAIGIDSAGFGNLTVRGGTVEGFGGAAIAASTGSKVIETSLIGNGAGITGGSDCLIVMNTIGANGGTGVTATTARSRTTRSPATPGRGSSGART